MMCAHHILAFVCVCRTRERESHVELCWCFSLPGEFTLRAFLNGRLDLSQAENVGRLVSAKSVAAADAALAGIQVCPRYRTQFSSAFVFLEVFVVFRYKLPANAYI
jgi:hypothetical protein